MRIFLVSSFRLSAFLTFLLLSITGCKKDEINNGCSSNGGIGAVKSRSVMFWTSQNFGCGPLHIANVRNTGTGKTIYQGPTSTTTMRSFSTLPSCGTNGAITISLDKGYEYEYTIACNGRQWTSKVIVNCGSDDCIAIQLK